MTKVSGYIETFKYLLFVHFLKSRLDVVFVNNSVSENCNIGLGPTKF